MAELYDGKMWLATNKVPSDELTATQFETSMFSYYSSGPHNIANCDSLHRPYNTHFYRPAVQRGSLRQGGGAYGGGRGNIMSDLETVHNYNQFLTPVQLQVERLRREERISRILQDRNLGIPGGVLKYDEQTKLNRGPRGEYRGKGTGVFIPRTSPVTKNIGIAVPTTRTRVESAKIKQENQVHSHINSEKKFDARKEAECHNQLSPELALPQEWTY